MAVQESTLVGRQGSLDTLLVRCQGRKGCASSQCHPDRQAPITTPRQGLKTETLLLVMTLTNSDNG